MRSCQTEEDKREVTEILAENERRLQDIFGRHDQLTGEGMPGHKRELAVTDYPIRRQWLTEEVWNNPLYKDLRKHGTVSALTKHYNEVNPGYGFTEEDIINELFRTRAARDPSFAFITVFEIKAKKGGGNIPFKLNYPQRVLLEILEELRLSGEPIRIILLKARQWGGSTLVQLYIAWVQLFVKEGWYSVIIAQTKDTAKRIKAMYK